MGDGTKRYWKSLSIISVFLLFFVFIFLAQAKIKQIGPTGFSIVGYLTKERESSYEVLLVSQDETQAFEYVNELRQEYDKDIIDWDDRAYALAVARAKDMYDRDYADHITPEGTCAKDVKLDYGFKLSEILAENIGIMTRYVNGTIVSNASAAGLVNQWMESRGHRYNLLYDDHKSGAIGCHKYICLFYGVHRNLFGIGAVSCTNGRQGNDFWKNSDKQKGEV